MLFRHNLESRVVPNEEPNDRQAKDVPQKKGETDQHQCEAEVHRVTTETVNAGGDQTARTFRGHGVKVVSCLLIAAPLPATIATAQAEK